jgi:hypothetical protein
MAPHPMEIDTTVTNPPAPSTPDTAPAAPVPPPAPVAQPQPAHGAASSTENKPSPPKDKKEPRKLTQLAKQGSSGIPPLLKVVATLSYYTEQNLATSFYVPSCINMFYILMLLDYRMLNTYRFTQSAPDWIPLISQLYISVLFYVQVLRAQRESGIIHPEYHSFLLAFEQRYDFRNLSVPGPLVPFFQSLTLSSSPFEWIGNICPGFRESDMPTRANNLLHTKAGIYKILPNPIVIIDQLKYILDMANVDSLTDNFRFFSNCMTRNAADTNPEAVWQFTLHSRFTFDLSEDILRRFWRSRHQFQFPARYPPDTSAAKLSMPEFLGFSSASHYGRFYNYFDIVSGIMQRYSRFTLHSTTLAAISPTGLGASNVIYTYEPNTVLDDNTPTVVAAVTNGPPVHYTRHFPTTFKGVASHADPELSELAEQYALASATNVSFSNRTHMPADSSLREGPYWDLPDVRTTDKVDPSQGYFNSIMADYHLDQQSRA